MPSRSCATIVAAMSALTTAGPGRHIVPLAGAKPKALLTQALPVRASPLIGSVVPSSGSSQAAPRPIPASNGPLPVLNAPAGLLQLASGCRSIQPGADFVQPS